MGDFTIFIVFITIVQQFLSIASCVFVTRSLFHNNKKKANNNSFKIPSRSNILFHSFTVACSQHSRSFHYFNSNDITFRVCFSFVLKHLTMLTMTSSVSAMQVGSRTNTILFTHWKHLLAPFMSVCEKILNKSSSLTTFFLLS